MKNPLLALLLGSASIVASPSYAQMTMPTDADPLACLVDIAPWFAPSPVSENGAVNPPSSVTFTDDNSNLGTGPNVCNFYQWGAQAFMWLTSPDGTNNGLVLDSDAIYNVLPAVTVGGKTTRLLQNANSTPRLDVSLRAGKSDVIGELEQAGGGVLMSQGKSLVYYGVHVNDIYADFLTGQKAGAIKVGTPPVEPKVFPRNADDLAAVKSYITSAELDAPVAPETLAMELKTSWVDASTVGEVSKFVTMPAIVPDYTANADNTVWTLSGTKEVTLALVGMHIVGTVQDHPEFVWATFEHISNAPDVSYWYTNTAGEPAEWSYDSSGSFLFTPTGAVADGANVQCMDTSDTPPGSIAANLDSSGNPVCAGGIVPSTTVRVRPWGSEPLAPSAAENTTTQKIHDQVISNNTMLVAINTAMISQMAAGDVRANYVQTGGIWTTTPSAGADAPIPNWTGDESSQMRGSLGLYNSTMETYSQSFAKNCFVCHSLNTSSADSFVSFGLSHIYSQIDALPTK